MPTASSPNREAMLRITEIQKRLSSRRASFDERRITASSLAKELGVSAKTMQRDLVYMRDTLKLPMKYDGQEQSWVFTAAVGDLPLVKITEGELLALVMARSAFHQYRGMPFEEKLQGALDKIENHLSADMEVDFIELSAAVSFRQPGTPVGDMDAFEKLAEGVTRRRAVSFEYRKNKSPAHEPRRIVHPYHLTAVGMEWYLVAFDPAKKALRNFRLGGMRGVTVEKHTNFKFHVGFDSKKYFAGTFGIFIGDNPDPVRIRFTRRAAEVIPTGEWHHTQKFTTEPDGSVILTMETGGLEEIAKWLMPLGDQAEVLSPPELIASLTARCEEVLARYQKK